MQALQTKEERQHKQRITMKEIKELVLCRCENAEHQMIFRSFRGGDDVYVTFHLKPLPFWQRLKHGVRYIFGYQCKYGAFDEMILNPEDAEKFAKVAKWLRSEQNSFEDET